MSRVLRGIVQVVWFVGGSVTVIFSLFGHTVVRSGCAWDRIMLVKKRGKVPILMLLIKDMCMDSLQEYPLVVGQSDGCPHTACR